MLDFGLAKAYASEAAGQSGPDLSQSPTLARTGTQAGLILGTAAYMSPEQARGKAVDKRADIWAFGIVPYEMLCGGSLFAGATVADTLAGVLRTEIDFALLPAETPPAIRRLLRRCLERNPKNRLHDIADARIVLEEVASGRNAERAPELSVPDPAAPERRGRAIAAGAALLVVGAFVGWLARRPEAPRAHPPSRWAHALPDGVTLSTDDRPQLDQIGHHGRHHDAILCSD